MNLKLQRFFEVFFMTCMIHCGDPAAATRFPENKCSENKHSLKLTGSTGARVWP